MDWRIVTTISVILSLAILAVAFSRLSADCASIAVGNAAQSQEQKASTSNANTKNGAVERECFLTRAGEDPVALFTGILTFFTGLLFIATCGLWYMAVRQAGDMKESIIAAQMSADAAIKAVNSDRAWVTPDGFNCGFSADIMIDGTRYDEGFMINLNWKNTGRSPAVRMRTYSDFTIANVGAPVPSFEVRRDTGDIKHHILGPGDRAYTDWKAVPKETYDKIKQHEIAMYMFSVVEYTSSIGDGQTKTTEICARVDVIGDQIDERGKRVPLAGLLSIGKQNSAT